MSYEGSNRAVTNLTRRIMDMQAKFRYQKSRGNPNAAMTLQQINRLREERAQLKASRNIIPIHPHKATTRAHRTIPLVYQPSVVQADKVSHAGSGISLSPHTTLAAGRVSPPCSLPVAFPTNVPGGI